MEPRKVSLQAPVSDLSLSSNTSPPYRGRFAPSPTGPLHFGSLVAALGSFLDARAHGGKWLLRMEDLDPPREQPGAADAILRALDTFELHWDGPVLYQSTRLDAYQSIAEKLLADGLAYACACSRREIADSALLGLEGPVYPGTCRNGAQAGKRAWAIRLQVPPDEIVSFTDSLQGNVHQHLARDLGDFVIRRADGYFAYQLAVVLDDAFQSITHVVRGADLLLSTPRQLYLQRLLGLRPLIYMHLPVAINGAGEKLSKQTGAAALAEKSPGVTLAEALEFLGQSPPTELRRAVPRELLKWAIGHWQPQLMTGSRTRRTIIEST
ncbi:MAG: tRNA glutamyl-Q(34) synthetase GluQRS [Gammaproteobacteria bacterium]